jgi:7-cyano-7-deazaguanine synthase in queuosine biosynthesis
MLQRINQFYLVSDYKNILNEINGLTYPFDPNWSDIAIALSGGADSTLLGYILSDFIYKNDLRTKIHFIHNIRCWKTKPWQKHIVDQIVIWFEKKFNHINYEVHYNFVPPDLEHSNTGKTILDEYGKLVSGDTIELRAYAEYICNQYNINAYFNGITKNPKESIQDEIESRNIDITEKNFRLAVMPHMNFLACHPFRFIDKAWIINTYAHLNLTDLLKITRSCEGQFPDIDYSNYVYGQYVPLCNNCFWCKERDWGIKNAK